MNILKKIKNKYKVWKETYFLKKHGCETWEQYHYRYDPDVVYRASTLKNFYNGYPYIYCFQDHTHDVYYYDFAYDGTFEVTKWCKDNLVDKFRFDFHRALKAPSTGDDWNINEIGGGDYLFFACKNPQDFTLFMLRWS
jgi:hypothetical protein